MVVVNNVWNVVMVRVGKLTNLVDFQIITVHEYREKVTAHKEGLIDELTLKYEKHKLKTRVGWFRLIRRTLYQ